jgi:hypothetical protein
LRLQLIERDHEIPPSDQYPPHGLPRRRERQDALRKQAQLACTESRLIGVQAHEPLLQVLGRTVPGTTTERRRRRRQPVLNQPTTVRAPQRATPSPNTPWHSRAQAFQREGKPHEQTDDGKAAAVEAAQGGIHPRELVGRLTPRSRSTQNSGEDLP